jgi:hypothetical protein
MKKKFSLIFFLLFFLAASHSFAQGFLSYPETIHGGLILLNGGIGFGGALDTKMQIPPLLLSGDFVLPVASLPFSVGLALGFSTEEETFKQRIGITTQSVTESSKNLALGFRLAYHPNIFSAARLDPYFIFLVGDILEWESVSVWDGVNTTAASEFDSDLWIGFGIGARYYFLPRLGAYAELQLGTLYNISFGISTKL